jgi:hypothetical protein
LTLAVNNLEGGQGVVVGVDVLGGGIYHPLVPVQVHITDMADSWREGYDAFRIAAQSDDDVCAARLVEHQKTSGFHLASGHDGFFHRGVLHVLASYGRVSVIRELCKGGWLSPHTLDRMGKDAAHVATVSAAIPPERIAEVVTLMLSEFKLDLCSTPDTAFRAAASFGLCGVMQVMIDRAVITTHSGHTCRNVVPTPVMWRGKCRRQSA